MEGVPEEFIDVYGKIRHIFEHVSSSDGDADLKDPIRSTYKSFTPTVEVAMTTLNFLENKSLCVALKDRVHTLKLELRLLRTAFRSMVKRCFEGGMQGRFMDILGRIQSLFLRVNQVLDLYAPKKNFNEDDAVNFVVLVYKLLENINIMKPKIMEAYYLLSESPSPTKYPMSAEHLVEFIYLVTDTLRDLLIIYNGPDPSKRKQILTVGEKLKFIAEFIWFTINQGTDGINQKEILISAEGMVDKAACFSYFLWINNEVNQKIDTELINSDGGHISAETLEDFQQFVHCISDEFEAAVLNFLGDNLMLLLKDEALTKVAVRTQFLALHEQVRFPEDLESYALIPRTEPREVPDVSGCGSPYKNMAAEICPRQKKLLEILKPAEAEFNEKYSKVVTQQKSNFPKVAPVEFINSFLEELKELISTKPDMIIDMKDQILAIHKELTFCRSFLQDFADQSVGDVKLDDVVNSITIAAYEAEHIISLMLVRAYPLWHKLMWISDFVEQIKIIKAAVGDISKDTSGDKRINIAEKGPSQAPAQTFALSDVVVGFKDEMELIKERLAGGSKRLDIVSIVGMPGLGKTTLAKRLYEDTLIVEHFYVRGWCYVSPYYSMNEMLLSLLGSVIKLTDEMRRMEDEELSEMLYKQLKGRRYLIVMDDVWGVDALEALKRLFPDDSMGSRILLTSRNKFIGLEAKYHSDPIELRLLTEDESWDLLKAKVFHQETCPLQLQQVGRQIAQKCNGLPLAVVVVAGLLARSDKKQGFWKQVSENLSSHILGDDEGQGMEVLELSYKLLPDHLKPLFLYLGAFPVDRVIPVRKLRWLWIAEGFVWKTKLKSLEDEAENNLMDLINRSLVTISDRKSDGRVKTCRVHDLLRDLCLAKAKEENFLRRIHVERLLSDSLHDPLIYEHRRLSIHRKDGNFSPAGYIIPMPCIPTMRSLMFFLSWDEIKYLSNLKLLRVLDLEIDFAGERLFDDLKVMVNLRYLSVSVWINSLSIPSSVVNLWNLETLIVQAADKILVPGEIWKMAQLRHLHINNKGKFILDDNAPQNTSKLLNLETFSTPLISFGEERKLMRRVPNLRKLRCTFLESQDFSDMFPKSKLVFPDQLESLNALYNDVAGRGCEFDLPLCLKKLTLSGFHLQWNVISSLQKLPNLEILKLVDVTLENDLWDMGDGDFPKLKFLKFERLKIKQWNASSDNFPCLEQLVVQYCRQLLEIPSNLGDICSLKSIAVEWCNPNAAESAKLIQEEQEDAGNDLLKVHIHPPCGQQEHD